MFIYASAGCLLTANNKTVSSIFFYFLKYESETLKSYYMNEFE